MAGQDSSFEEEDWFQYIDLDQAEEVHQVGAWEGEDREVQNVEDHLPSEHTRSPGLDAPDWRENTGQGRDEGDLDTSIILEQLAQQHQEAVEGYFIGLEGQRNAPSGHGGTGIEDVEHPYQLESPDAETGELEQQQQQQTPVAESLPVSETEWANTTSTTEDWSLIDEQTGAAGSSSQPDAAHDDPSQDTQRDHHGQLVCNHAGCGATYDCLSKLKHHRRKHIPMKDRPIACPLCPGGMVRFLHQKDLNKHLQTLRHRQRQFQCSDCQSMFTRPDLLRRHRNICRRVRPP